MKFYTFPSIIIKDKFKYHNKIQKDLLKEIKKSKDENLIKKDKYFNDNISKTDWHKADDFERDWTKKYGKLFGDELSYYAGRLGYQGITLNKLWYQGYSFDGTHGWHVHHGNYTGAYFLQLPEGTPYTEFLLTTNLKKSFSIEVKEGDLLFFPCHFIHRSAENKSSEEKIIISWNLEFEDILEEHVYDEKNFELIK